MPTEQEWQQIRARATNFPPEAFQFVRAGLHHTVQSIHGEPLAVSAKGAASGQMVIKLPVDPTDERRHISGQQLCLGIRDLAIQRYGLLARTVLNKWGIRRSEDFGTLVYAMIDRGELRSSPNDRIEDFQGVFDFDEAFNQIGLN